MKKNFLLLFLMALLPLSTFADNIKITPVNASKTYGDADPIHPKATWFDWSTTSGTLPTGVTVTSTTTPDPKAIDQQLTFMRLTQGETVGNYSYTFEDESTVSDGTNNHNLLIMSNGQFTIKQKDLNTFDGSTGNKITLTLVNPMYVNGSTQIKPTASDIKITVELAVNSLNGDLVEGTDYVITGYGTNTSVGTGTITIEGKGNYKGTKDFDFTINATALSTLGTPSYIGSALTYDGTAKTPSATDFKFGNVTAGGNFQIKSGSYTNNTNAGTAKVILEGITNYSGEVEATFPIAKLAVSSTNPFTEDGTDPKYNGAAQGPTSPTFKVGTYTLAATDYELTNLGTNVGEHTAKLKFKENGNFSGADQDVTYNIVAQDFTSTAGVSVEFNKEGSTEITDYIYSNADVKPAFKVIYTVGTKKYELTEDDYTFVYQDATGGTDLKNVQDGKKLIVTGRRNFTTVALTAKTYNVKKRTVKVGAASLEVGMGADVAPVATYDAFPAGHTAASLGITPTFTYTLLNTDGSETGTTKSQAEIKAAAIGKYNIHVNVAALNAAVSSAAAGSPLKNYTFAEVATASLGKLTKVAGQVVVKVKDREITYGDAFPTTGWTVEHVSGLAEADQTGANFNSIIGALNQTKFAFVNTPDAVNANAEGYDVNYNNGSITNGDYAITVLPGKLIVKKKAITQAMIQINGGAALTYTGKAQYPEVNVDIDANFATPAGLLPTNYYTTEYDESYNAGARSAKISMSGAGQTNYITETKVLYVATDPEVVAGTAAVGDLKETLPYVIAPYNINKVALTIKADNFTGENAWTYGTEEPAYTAKLTAGEAVEGEASLITSLLAGEQPAGFNGKLIITRTGATTVGDHAGSLVPSFVKADGTAVAVANAADNYSFTLQNGDLTIKKGKIIAKVKDITLAYGETAAAGTFQLEAVSGMDEAEAANFDAIVTYDKPIAKFGYTDAYKAIGSHTLAYTGATPTATNYDVVLADGDAAKGTLTVVKRPVTFKAVDFTGTNAIAYNALNTWTPAVNATYVKQIATGDPEYDAATCYTLLAGDNMTDLIASVKEQSKNVGDNIIKLTKKESAIYDIILLDGTLEITSTGVLPITLNRVVKASFDDAHTNTAAKLIEQNDGKFVDVRFSDFPMIAEKWYPLVLPFATSVKEISAAFGYAVVDVFNGLNANGDIQFKLHMGDIPANQPFIVKVYQDMNMADPTVVFNNALIENGEPVQGDASSVQFVGTYTGKVDGFRSNEYYFSTNASLNEYYKGNDTNKTYLRPLGAYFVDNTPDAASTSRSIVIEEIDGSTTAIQGITQDDTSVSADGWYTIKGIKLEGAPTQKGVYIKDGKKVVIK
ncbi:MAG: hypothetical protein J5952_03930 [Prevotella sp.]|nr:hypothetical protein [Prevotella sp.]